MLNAFKIFIYYVITLFILMFAVIFLYINSGNDINLLGDYLNSIQIYLVIIISLIFIPISIIEYKKLNIKETKLKNIHLIIIFGIFLSISYNILTYYLNKYFFQTNIYGNNNEIVLNIIRTGILGPIIEELIFRGIIYNKLKLKHDNKKSILITTIVFTLSHFNIIQMIYAFIIGILLIYVYNKYNNLKAPIILHITSNITTTLITILIIKEYILLNIILFIISTLILYIVYKIVKKYDII